MSRIVVALAIILVVYWTLLFFGQRALAFPAPDVSTAARRPADAQQVWLETDAGRTEAWFLPPLVTSESRAPLIVFAHGNGELIDYWPPDFVEPRRWGVAVMLVEFPGYGRSGGKPTQRSIQQAFEAAYDWALGHQPVDSSRIILYGRSIGGGAASGLSRTRPAAAMILESSFTDLASMARAYGAPQFLVRDRFDNLAAVTSFKGPKLIMHGDRDEIIPTEHGRRLAKSAGVELHVMKCGHNDCERPWPVVKEFLRANRFLSP